MKGKQIKKSLRTNDRQLANRRLADLRARAHRLQGTQHKNIRFEELAEEWLASIQGDLKPASHRRRKVAVNALNSIFSGQLVRSMGYADIEKWKRLRSEVSARTYNIDLETLRMIFEYAINRGILLDNPAVKFNRRKQPRREVHPPTLNQFSALIGELRNSSKAIASGAADMVEFLAYSGMRLGEACEVRRCDIEWEPRRILITGGELGPKNHEQRRIPIFPNLAGVIKRVLASKTVLSPNARLFNIKSPRSAMGLACKRTGLPSFNVHSLRHFFATNAIESGASFKTVASWLGHSDGGVLVARTYGHLRAEFMQEAAQRMTFQVIETPS